MIKRYLVLCDIEVWGNGVENWVRGSYDNPRKEGGYKSLTEAIKVARNFGCSTIIEVIYASDTLHAQAQAKRGGASEDD